MSYELKEKASFDIDKDLWLGNFTIAEKCLATSSFHQT